MALPNRALRQDQVQVLVEELERLASVHRWTGAAITGEIVPELEEYVQVGRILDAARRWHERAAA